MRIPLLLAGAAAALIALTPATAQIGGRSFSAYLTGRAEVPGPGDRNASGSATVRLNYGQRRICYNLSVRRVQGIMGAHIHRGRAGVAGPVVLPLRTSPSGYSSGCTHASRALINEIGRDPRRFYVNVHSRRYPDGAIRGQLHR